MSRRHIPVVLRWADMDAYGHVNNVVFLQLLEEARIGALAASGSEEGGSMLDTGVLVGRAEIEYLVPLRYRHEPVIVDVWVSHLGGASFDLGYEVRDGREGPDDVVYARAETTMVVYDLEGHRPRRLAAHERDKLVAWSEPPVALRRRREGRE
jgi:acyl-CoA thioester hydrolase